MVSDAVTQEMPLCCINGGLVFDFIQIGRVYSDGTMVETLFSYRSLEQRLTNFFFKVSVNILGFTGHMISIIITQL